MLSVTSWEGVFEDAYGTLTIYWLLIKSPVAAVGPVHAEPSLNRWVPSPMGDGVPSCIVLGLRTPTKAGFPVTWCWLTLTGASRAVQGLVLR